MVFKSSPVEEAMTPFPMPLMTPPETRTYFMIADRAEKEMQVAVAGCCQAGKKRSLVLKLVEFLCFALLANAL